MTTTPSGSESRRIKGVLETPSELDPNDFEEGPYTLIAMRYSIQYPDGGGFVGSCASRSESPPPYLDTETYLTPDYLPGSNSLSSACAHDHIACGRT